MKNKWLTYGFLALLVIALGSLAVLQYQWLGSVSEAEKDRLEENLEASTENFAADYNRIFQQTFQSFKLSVNTEEAAYDTLIGNAYLNWLASTEYPGLVDSVYFVETSDDGAEVLLFKSDPVSLESVQASKKVLQWITNHFNKTDHRTKSVTITNDPDFGDPSFLSVPVQLLDVVTIGEPGLGKNIKVNLSVDQLNSVVLLQLDDAVIREQVIPDIASRYLSDSYRDQYELSIVNTGRKDSVYFTTVESNSLPDPDFKNRLNKFSLTNFMVFKSQNEFSGDLLTSALDSLKGTVESIHIENFSNRADSARYIVSSEERQTSLLSQGSFTGIDTTIRASFIGGLPAQNWELWLSFKAGSLDAFVNKTRYKNLLISFGILLILGISGILIVLFSQRSRQLADQQMLFVAGVSHELRTPITVIRSAAENLSEGMIKNEQRREEYANLMLREGRRLSDMVDQIMEFSGIQSGRKVYQFQEIDMQEFVHHIKQETAPLLKEKEMKMEYTIIGSPDFFTADYEGLSVAVMNLIQNAIKFGPRQGEIKLRVDGIEWKGEKAVQFQVQDFGTGIPQSEQEKIFEPFYRGRRSVEEQVRGNGIGLSLVKKIAEAHGGMIRVNSEEGAGSVFSLIIPSGR